MDKTVTNFTLPTEGFERRHLNNGNMVTLRFYEDTKADEDIELVSIESTCQPFSVGDKIWIDIKNNFPQTWDIENKRVWFLIEKIHIEISKRYNVSVIEHLDVFITGKIV